MLSAAPQKFVWDQDVNFEGIKMFALGVKWIEKLWLGLFFGDTPLANTTQMLIYE